MRKTRSGALTQRARVRVFDVARAEPAFLVPVLPGDAAVALPMALVFTRRQLL